MLSGSSPFWHDHERPQWTLMRCTNLCEYIYIYTHTSIDVEDFSHFSLFLPSHRWSISTLLTCRCPAYKHILICIANTFILSLSLSFFLPSNRYFTSSTTTHCTDTHRNDVWAIRETRHQCTIITTCPYLSLAFKPTKDRHTMERSK